MSEVKSFSEQLLENYPSKIPIEFLDDEIVDCDKPVQLDNQLPEFDLLEEHQRCDLSDILEYYKGLTDGCRIMDASFDDNVILNDIQCDHCKMHNQWAILCECGKHMCSLCWTEKTEEQAIVNGAKNWKSREESLKQCFTHKQISSMQRQVDDYRCDGCGSGFEDKTALHCRLKNLDLCSDCIGAENGKKIMELSQHPDGFQTWFEHKSISFGLIPEFVPVMKSDEHILLYNINPASKYYHRVMLNTSDDHGRTGYYMVKTNLNDTIEALKPLVVNYKAQKDPSWEHHYASPISQLAQDLGFQVYLG